MSCLWPVCFISGVACQCASHTFIIFSKLILVSLASYVHFIKFPNTVQVVMRHPRSLTATLKHNIFPHIVNLSCFCSVSCKISLSLLRFSLLLHSLIGSLSLSVPGFWPVFMLFPAGFELLYQPEVVRLYLSLLTESQNYNTLEAAAGALQNLSAGQWTVSVGRGGVHIQNTGCISIMVLRLSFSIIK